MPTRRLLHAIKHQKSTRVLSSTLFGIAIAVFISGTAFSQDAQNTGDKPPATLVQVDTVKIVPFVQTFPIIGRFIARQAGVVAARVKGAISTINVDVGDRVEAGSIMAVLVRDRLQWELNLYKAEVANYTAQSETKKAKINLLDKELKRLDSLRKSPAFSQARQEDKQQSILVAKSEAAEARAQLRRAQANLKLRQIDYQDGEIKAPYGGVVTQKHTSVGSYVNVGSPVFTLIDDTTLEIEADVPSERISSLKPGIVINVSLNKKSKIKATVRAVVPEENPQTRTRAVRFEPFEMIGVENLAANQSVTLNLPSGARQDILSVHKDAVLNRRGSQLVVLVEKGKAAFRPVKLGEASGNRFLVIGGLKSGDVVVIRGNERLRPHQPIRYKGMPKPASGQVQSNDIPRQKKVEG